MLKDVDTPAVRGPPISTRLCISLALVVETDGAMGAATVLCGC